jgi:hypothetical protein
MIKTGDKVVCIKDMSNIQHLNYTLHEIYSVSLIKHRIRYEYNSYYSIRIEDESKIGWYFESIDLNNLLYFYDYFMTLAEWREKQINSILEDD